MCGFAGELLFGAGPADLILARKMASTLRHRGPDEEGSVLSADGRCAMAVQRLAVIDPAASHQPMTSPDGAVTVAFNGEIYNYKLLREELARGGATFRTAGDTEVLLHLYQRHGQSMLQKLDGMFAFAIYDSTAGALLLARDRFGQKPLWYAALNDRLVFGSQARALLEHPAISKALDAASITHYASFGYIPWPMSVWRDLRKLPPAHAMRASTRAEQPDRYWSPHPVQLPAPAERLADTVREILASSVRQHMLADVPLGALLSGGVDSSIVVALMSRAAGRVGGVRTFSAGFADRAFDERPTARAVATHCGTDHTELLVRCAPAELLDQLVAMYDEPFGDSSALPTWLTCKAARQHVTVALSGDGGDEVFGGYDRYRALALAGGMGPGGYAVTRLAALAVRPWAPRDERKRLRRFVRFADALPYPPSIQYFMHRRLFGPEDLGRLFTEDFAEQVDLDEPARWFCELYEQADLADEVARAQRHDMLTYLPDDLLVKTDIASMAASLELRAPMLDHRLAVLGLSLPVGSKVSRGGGKRILREAFGELLPMEVFKRPKHGFAVPVGDWLRGELAETLRQTLLDRSLEEQGIFRREALAGLINDHLAGRDDHRHRLWALLVLGRWFRLRG